MIEDLHVNLTIPPYIVSEECIISAGDNKLVPTGIIDLIVGKPSTDYDVRSYLYIYNELGFMICR